MVMTAYATEFGSIPVALSNLLGHYRDAEPALLQRGRKLLDAVDALHVVGMGSSLFAARACADRFPHRICCVHDAGEWLHYAAYPGDRRATILVSQSGESAELVRLVESGRVGGPAIVITNDPGSRLAAAADLVLPICAGKEVSIASKTYTNTLALLHLLSAGADNRAFDELARVAQVMSDVDARSVDTAATLLLNAVHIAFVARGPACATASQCALSFMEALCIPTAAYTAGAFRHGPIEAAGPQLPLVFAIPEGRTDTLTLGLARDAARFGSPVVLLTDLTTLDGDPDLHVIRVPRPDLACSEPLFPLTASYAHFLLLDALARARGIADVGLRHGAKITATE